MRKSVKFPLLDSITCEGTSESGVTITDLMFGYSNELRSALLVDVDVNSFTFGLRYEDIRCSDESVRISFGVWREEYVLLPDAPPEEK